MKEKRNRQNRQLRRGLFWTGTLFAGIGIVRGLIGAIESPVQAYEPTLSGSGSRSTETTPPPLVATATAKPAEAQVAHICELSPKFPDKVLQWCDLITGYAHLRGFEPNLIAALIVQESGGDPNVISYAGAVGLMQVMPRDGIAANFVNSRGEPFFADRPTIEELKDPTKNVDYGTGLLQAIRAEFERGLTSKQLADQTVDRAVWRQMLFKYGPRGIGYAYADKVLAIFDAMGAVSQ